MQAGTNRGATAQTGRSAETRRRETNARVTASRGQLGYGRSSGIVTRADIVRTYLRSDADIADSVREHVLRETMQLDPRRFVVDVHDGDVSISGSVDLRSGAQIIERFVRMVPGVIDVTADVSWSMDDRDVDVPPSDHLFPLGRG